MKPEPTSNRRDTSPAPYQHQVRRSAVLAVLGLVWAAVFFCILMLFEGFEGIVGGRNTAPWAWMMWGIFGPQIIMGVSVMTGGRFMPRPLRALFVLATLATLGAGVVAAGQINGSTDHVAFLAISGLTAMIPQIIGWRRR